MNIDENFEHNEEEAMKPKNTSVKKFEYRKKGELRYLFFYERLDMENSLICELRDNEIVLCAEPIEADFSTEILKEIVSGCYVGDRLITEFEKRKAKIRPAVEAMMVEAEQVAKAFTGTVDEETEDLFGDVRE